MEPFLAFFTSFHKSHADAAETLGLFFQMGASGGRSMPSAHPRRTMCLNGNWFAGYCLPKSFHLHVFLSFSLREHRCRWLLAPWRRWHLQSSGGNRQLGRVSVSKKSTSGACWESHPLCWGFLPTSPVKWQIGCCVAVLPIMCKSLLWIWEWLFFPQSFFFSNTDRVESIPGLHC